MSFQKLPNSNTKYFNFYQQNTPSGNFRAFFLINIKAKFRKKPELCLNKQLDNEKELFTAADFPFGVFLSAGIYAGYFGKRF